MPWLNNIDAVRPADTEFVSEGAMRFRELKRALIERLETAYAGFPGENPDRAGEALLFPIVSVMVGTQAQRPETPVREGHGWFSLDTSELWIGTPELTWQQVTAGGSGTGTGVTTPNFTRYAFSLVLSSIPSAATPGFPYQWLLANDVNRGRRLREIRYRMRRTTSEWANAWGVMPGTRALPLEAWDTGQEFLVLDQLGIDFAGIPYSFDSDIVDWNGIFRVQNNSGSTQSYQVEVVLDLWND